MPGENTPQSIDNLVYTDWRVVRVFDSGTVVTEGFSRITGEVIEGHPSAKHLSEQLGTELKPRLRFHVHRIVRWYDDELPKESFEYCVVPESSPLHPLDIPKSEAEKDKSTEVEKVDPNIKYL